MDCQRWEGKTQSGRGYGYLYVNGVRWYAHRWTFLQHYGFLPPVVRHTCDNEWCVEPTHLIAGTQADNLQDCFDRGRARRAQGVDVSTAKLNPDSVQEIRSLIGTTTISDLARAYGVDRKTIRKVRDGMTWKGSESHRT